MVVQVNQAVYDEIVNLRFVYQRNADMATKARDAAETQRSQAQEFADDTDPVIADLEVI